MRSIVINDIRNFVFQSKKTSQQKANFFCQYIIRANDDAFRVLRNVLYETSQVHIAEELKKIKNNIGWVKSIIVFILYYSNNILLTSRNLLFSHFEKK